MYTYLQCQRILLSSKMHFNITYIIITYYIIIISNLSDIRQVHSLFQNDSSTYSDRELTPSNESILSCLQASRIHGISVSGKRLSRKSDSFSICFPHRSTTAVQTTLVTPVATRTWTISSIICSVLQDATDDAASGISFWCLSSSDAYPLTCPARETLPVATLPLVYTDKYVMLIAFPRQQLIPERTSVLPYTYEYTACLVSKSHTTLFRYGLNSIVYGIRCSSVDIVS
jgi:hypothetical protein